MSFLAGSEKGTRFRIATTIRGISWLLSSGGTPREGISSALDLRVRIGSTMAPPPPTESARALRHVPAYLQKIMAGHVGELWKGGLWHHPAHQVFVALNLLQSEIEQSIAVNDLMFYEKLRYGGMPNRSHSLSIMKEFKMKPSDTIPANIMESLVGHIANLEQALLNKDPLLPVHLRNSHALIMSYPETQHLLEDHEIATIIQGCETHMKVQIVKAAAKGSKSKGPNKNISASEL